MKPLRQIPKELRAGMAVDCTPCGLDSPSSFVVGLMGRGVWGQGQEN